VSSSTDAARPAIPDCPRYQSGLPDQQFRISRLSVPDWPV
jgi:hypothetical protein